MPLKQHNLMSEIARANGVTKQTVLLKHPISGNALRRAEAPRPDSGSTETSPEQAVALPAMDCGYVQAAIRRVVQVRMSEAVPPEPPTLIELEKALGERVLGCEIWTRNWRNRIYRVELASGGVVIAKQFIMGTGEGFQCEYNQLEALARLQIPGLRVSKVLALLPAKRTYVMDLARGKTIPALLWNRGGTGDVLMACELAGKILAQMHLAWTENISPMPVDLLARDLAATPWDLSSRERKTLRSVLEVLARAEVRIGHVYYDYKPANFLFETNELFLIDPPAILRRGVQLWDFSLFRSSMRRELWKLSLRRPFDRRGVVARESLAAFERGYLANFAQPHPEPALFPLAARLFDLQRTAVLVTMQKGKIAATRKKIPLNGDGRFGGTFVNRATLPLLEIEKRWLFRQLARELSI